MRRAALVSLALALAMAVAASPLAAQTVPDEPAAPSQPPPEPPPHVPPSSNELPPPFPRYPAARPREHNPNYHPGHAHGRPASSHAGKARHHATTHRAKAHHHATRQYFSKRTIRQCHRMSYKEIMRYKNCRTMMKQDLAAAERQRHHARRHSSARHSAHRKARRHRG